MYVPWCNTVLREKSFTKRALNSDLLKTISRGIKKYMPPKAVSRIAFLLIPSNFALRLRKTWLFVLKRAIASIRFFSMLRFHFCGWRNLTLVLEGGGGCAIKIHAIVKSCWVCLPQTVFLDFILHSTINFIPEQEHTSVRLLIYIGTESILPIKTFISRMEMQSTVGVQLFLLIHYLG